MNRVTWRAAPLLMMSVAACDRAGPPSAPATAPSATATANPVAGDKSIMRPAIQAEAGPVAAAPVAPRTVTVPFAYDGAMLDDAACATLDRLARAPDTATATSIVIRGHTDAAGSDRANLRIAMARAVAVRDHLATAGVTVPMTLIALGERRPVRPNATLDGADDPAGRAANRRVEITLR